MNLTLFTTQGCHLCDEAWALLQEVALAEHTVLSDIIDNDAWLAAYGVRIPVLRRSDGAELDWPFTAADIIAFNRVHE